MFKKAHLIQTKNNFGCKVFFINLLTTIPSADPKSIEDKPCTIISVLNCNCESTNTWGLFCLLNLLPSSLLYQNLMVNLTLLLTSPENNITKYS